MRIASRRVTVVLSGLIALGCARQPSGDEGSQPSTGASAAARPSAPAPAPSFELRGTDWRLVALGDKPVTVADTQRAPRITLAPDSKQVTGSGGCNRMFGVYELNGDALRFSGVGSTKMACQDGMDTESAFLSSLLRVARWRVAGQQLELSDSAGAVLARFEARVPR
jgi:heat shock protein HslJ